jgi:chromosome segregation ATPase
MTAEDELRADVKIRDAEITRQHGIIQHLDAENERLRDALAGKERYEEEAERQFSEAATEWGRITSERDEARSQLAAAEARLEAVKAAFGWRLQPCAPVPIWVQRAAAAVSVAS